MIKFKPSTCHCVIAIPDDPYNESRATQLEKCRTHNTAIDCLTHNRSLQNETKEIRSQERKKPEFQRR